MSFGVRVFDTVLDSRNLKDTTTRSSSSFWKEFCQASDWSFSYERIHSLADLQVFLKKTIKEDFIIFSGHGNDSGWHMTNGDALSPQTLSELDINDKNRNKNVIFSSYLMATNDDVCFKIKKLLFAKRIFAYRHIMQDRFCFLNESILLTLIEQKDSFNQKDFEDFQEKTKFMKNINQKHVKLHPMKMYD